MIIVLAVVSVFSLKLFLLIPSLKSRLNTTPTNLLPSYQIYVYSYLWYFHLLGSNMQCLFTTQVPKLEEGGLASEGCTVYNSWERCQCSLLLYEYPLY